MPDENSRPVIFRQLESLDVFGEKIKKNQYLMRESRQVGAISVSYWGNNHKLNHLRYVYVKQPPRSETPYETMEGEAISPADEYKWVKVQDGGDAQRLLAGNDVKTFDLSLKSGDAFEALMTIVETRMGDKVMVKPEIEEATQEEAYSAYCDAEDLLGHKP